MKWRHAFCERAAKRERETHGLCHTLLLASGCPRGAQWRTHKSMMRAPSSSCCCSSCARFVSSVFSVFALARIMEPNKIIDFLLLQASGEKSVSLASDWPLLVCGPAGTCALGQSSREQQRVALRSGESESQQARREQKAAHTRAARAQRLLQISTGDKSRRAQLQRDTRAQFSASVRSFTSFVLVRAN